MQGHNNDQGGGRGQARDHNRMAKGLPAQLIQVLQHASSILSKITGTMYATQRENEEEALVNVGNSFGGASYGSQSGRMANGQGRGRNISKLVTRDRHQVNSTTSHTNPELIQEKRLQPVKWTIMLTPVA